MKQKTKNWYINYISSRRKKVRAHTEYQDAGVEVAQILEDTKHTGLYIKLAKECGSKKLIDTAKDVASRPDVKNKGAYFMKLWHMKK